MHTRLPTALVPLTELGLQPPAEVCGYRSASLCLYICMTVSLRPMHDCCIFCTQAAYLGMADVQDRMRALDASNQQQHPPITYLHLFEDEEMSMGIFCLPAGATIPLHDHPDMTVFSRVLYGQLFIQAFDWVKDGSDANTTATNGEHGKGGARAGRDNPNGDIDEDDHHAAARPAKLVVARVQGVNDPAAVLFPRHNGNIHTFTALTDCAVLDVLSPPYSSKSGRDCTYYYVASHDATHPGLVTLVRAAGVEPWSERVCTRCVARRSKTHRMTLRSSVGSTRVSRWMRMAGNTALSS